MTYSMSQITLREYGLLDEVGRPLKLKKNDRSEKNLDALAIYEWAAEKTKGISEAKLQSIGKELNEIAQSLHDDYTMNKYLFLLFLFEKYLLFEASGIDKNMMLPKVIRLIKIMRQEIVSVNGVTKEEIIKDSATLGSNMWKMLNDEVELTKEVRAARVRMWAEASRNKPKEKKTSILDKYKFK